MSETGRHEGGGGIQTSPGAHTEDNRHEDNRHESNRHEAPRSALADVKAAFAPRALLLVLGVLVLQLGFILSYVGAFHAPTPDRVPVAVVAPEQLRTQLVEKLDTLPSTPLDATAVSDEATAQSQLADGSTSGVLLVDPQGTNDTVLTASGAGTSVSTAVQEVLIKAEQAQQRTVTVSDEVPLQAGDARGLSGFYLVIGWTVGGYLVASVLGVTQGARPRTARVTALRLATAAVYSVLSGLGGALLVGPILGALTGHFFALWALGALVVFGAAAVTIAFQVLFGVLGIALTILVYVVLGNPSAGGAYQPALLPPFWRGISGALPNGAGVDAVRRIVYLGGHGTGGNIAVLAAYAVVAAVVAVGVTAVRERRFSSVSGSPSAQPA